MEKALVCQEVDVVLVIEQRRCRCIVVDCRSARASRALFRNLPRVALVHGGVAGHQASVGVLSESIAECVAVRRAYGVCTFNYIGEVNSMRFDTNKQYKNFVSS